MFDYSVVDRIVDRIVEQFSPMMIVIFGSVARHAAKKGSDVDILMVMDTDGDPLKRGVPIKLCLHDILIDKDIIVVTPEEFEQEKDDEYSFVNEIVRTGYVAYSAKDPPAIQHSGLRCRFLNRQGEPSHRGGSR